MFPPVWVMRKETTVVIGDWLKRMKYDLVCGSLDQNVDEVIYDSRKARPDSVFVCIQGSTRDSHEFIPDVLRLAVSSCGRKRSGSTGGCDCDPG